MGAVMCSQRLFLCHSRNPRHRAGVGENLPHAVGVTGSEATARGAEPLWGAVLSVSEAERQVLVRRSYNEGAAEPYWGRLLIGQDRVYKCVLAVFLSMVVT